MSFDLGVWYSDKPLTDEEASDLYIMLCERTWNPIEENPAVDAFYAELTSRYPEIDSLPEEERAGCPWSCAHERSGLHVLLEISWSRCEEIAPIVKELAERHGLVCFDSQESKVYLPPHLKPKRPPLRSWWNRIRLLMGGMVILAVVALVGQAQELDPHSPEVIADGLNRSSVVVIGKFAVDWCWPWLDGWHCSGAIHVEESLYGDLKAHEAVSLRWVEEYGGCMMCGGSTLRGKSGIWFVAQKNEAWHLSGASYWRCGPLPMNCRDEVVQCIRQRGGK